LLELNQAIKDINAAYDGYEFQHITNRLYEFFWAYYCDWYVEAVKSVLYGEDNQKKGSTLCIMDFVLSNTLRLLHPFIPFITEELWISFGFGGATIQFAPWPSELDESVLTKLDLKSEVFHFVSQKHETVTSARNLRASYNIPTNRKTKFAFIPKGPWHQDPYEVNALKSLLNADVLEFVQSPPHGAASAVTPLGEIYLPLEGLVDVSAEKKRLELQIGKLQKELENISLKLNDTGFTQRAPKEAVEKHQTRASQIKADIEKIESQITILTS
jgi:valyl-tRNA synthetase